MRITKKIAQELLRIHDDSHIGDIATLPERISADDDTVERLARAKYIVEAGDRYVITGKALYR